MDLEFYKHSVPPGLSDLVRNFVRKTRTYGLAAQKTQRLRREELNLRYYETQRQPDISLYIPYNS